MRTILICLALLLGLPAFGNTYTAISGAYVDVSNAVSMSTFGDTVVIPPGTNKWFSTLNVSGITLRGSGTNSTVIIDETPVSGGFSTTSIFTVSSTDSSLTRITQLQITHGVTNNNLTGNSRGEIAVFGTSYNMRIDHCFFNNTGGKPLVTNGSKGLVDHCAFTSRNNDQIEVQGSGAWGDAEWAAPDAFGTTNQLYIESNYFWSPNAFSAIDSEAGGVACIRDNVFTNDVFIHDHGADTGQRDRSTRSLEVYNNVFFYQGQGQFDDKDVAIDITGGTALVFSNSVTGFNIVCTLQTYRATDYTADFTPWFGANGAIPWDSNSPPAMTLTAISNSTTTIYSITNTFVNNAWYGYSVSNSRSGLIGIISGNNSNSFSIFPSVRNNGFNLSINIGDNLTFALVYPMVDQVGRGQGRLDTNDVPNPGWLQEVSSPVYGWSNSLACWFSSFPFPTTGDPSIYTNTFAGAFEAGHPYPNIQDGRDFFNHTAKPGYTPLAYPHPLDTADLVSPPSGVTNLAAVAVSTSEIDLVWYASATSTSYSLSQSTVSGGPYTNIYTGSATNFSNTSLVSATPYFYVVSASNSGGVSTNSLEASATTFTNPPPTVTNLVATTLSSSSIGLVWYSAPRASSYKLSRGTVTGGPYTNVYTGATTNFIDTVLQPSTAYFYVAYATGTGGTNSASLEATATTSPAVYPTNVVYTTHRDPATGIYTITTNTIPANGFTIIGAVTNYSVITNNPGSYTVVYTTVFDTSIMNYVLVTNYVRISLTTNTTVSTPPVSTTVTYGPQTLTNFTVTTAQNQSVLVDPSMHIQDTNGYTAFITGVTALHGSVSHSPVAIVYTPPANYVGADTLTVTLSDLSTMTGSGTVTMSVTNRLPAQTTALPTIATFRYNSTPVNLTNYFTDPAGYPIYLTNFTFYAGVVTYSNMSFTLTTSSNRLGNTNVDFSVTDGYGSSRFSIPLSVQDHAPITFGTTVSTLRNVGVTFQITNQFCTDLETDLLHIVSTTPTNCTAVISGGNVVFTPSTDFLGFASFGYTVSDGTLTSTSVINVSVAGLPPVATNISLTLLRNSVVSVPVLTYCFSPYGFPLSIDSVTTNNAMAVISGTNVLVQGANIGSGTVGYTVTDGQFAFGSAVINLTTTNQMIATNFSISTAINHPISFDFLLHTFVASGDIPGTCGLSGYSHGYLTPLFSSSGAYSYTPSHNFVGSDTVNYTMCAAGSTASGVLTINMTNAPPVVAATSISGVHELPITVNEITNAYSPTGVGMGLHTVSASHGTAVISGGKVVYTPNTSYVGSDTISCTVTDELAQSASGNIAVTLTNSLTPVAPNFGYNPSFDPTTPTNTPYYWQANIPIPVYPAITNQVSHLAPNYLNPLQPLLHAFSPNGIPLILTSVTPHNCLAAIDSTGTNIDYALTVFELVVVSVDYTVSDHVNTATGTIQLDDSKPIDTVITNWVNNLHVNGSGSISIQGFNIDVKATVSIIYTTLAGPPATLAVFGSCQANPNGSTIDFYPGTVDGPANVTWPGTGCVCTVVVPGQSTITLPANGTGNLILMYSGRNTGQTRTVTNNFVPLP